MKYQSTILLLLLAAMLTGCQKQVTIETNDTTGKVTVTLPAENVGAAELIQARGLADASFTLRAERERMVFDLQSAKLRKSERQFYAVLIVGGVVFGILSVFSIACFVLLRRVGGAKP